MEDGRGGSGYLQAINQTDAPTVFIDPDKTTGSITLIAAKTYYFPIGGQPMSEDALVSVHAAWALALAGTWTIEVSNFPWKVGNGVSGGADSDWTDQTAGNWIQENPSSAVISTAGAGNTATGATVTAGGTNAGGFFAHLGNLGARRARLKFVCTVGGAVKVNVHGKVGA